MASEQLTSKEYAKMSLRDILEREWPPCRMACPAHVDVRAYLELAARGFYQEALAIIRERLPFPGVCGRICHHPCEEACRRNDVDEPAAIRDLKRFIFEHAADDLAKIAKPEQVREKVAVIGGGPAGLTAAYDLARAGFQPTVFDSAPVLGGILATAIPKYRLPREVIQRDVDYILAHGVEAKTGVQIGKDITLDQLRQEGYKAIVIAVGLSQSRSLPIPGSDHPDVHQTLPFLWAAAFGEKVDIGKDVLVIGGGNVAIDVGRTALRLGAERVRLVCLENEEEIPAWDWEICEANEEGIEIIHRRAPKQVVIEGDKITGLETKGVTRVFDEEKRFSPQYDESDVSTIECDTIIFAIGQASDLSFLEGTGIKTDERGRLEYNADTGQTSAEDVFATGEVVTGPGSAVEAVASGHRIAKAIQTYLEGGEIDLAEELPPEIEKLPEASVPKIPRTERPKMPTVAPEERKKNFDAFELGFEEVVAVAEARRCMSCGAGAEVLADKCSACLTCLRVCPFDVPEVTDIARMPSAICQACSLCVTECPGNAIVMKGYAITDILNDIQNAIAKMDGADTRLLVIGCGHHAPPVVPRDEGIPGVAEVYLPTIGRLGVTDMLHAFEYGADGVLIVECESGTCRYPTVGERVARRTDQVRGMLKETGLGEDRLMLRVGVAGDRAATESAIREAVEALKELGPSPARQ
ncbi:MAG: FAD-dependent oxidoreductase [Planctomycetes bacterium]|nr:FAD-dependent oxidoreductase [Planctomycetota bacterium]